MDPPPLSLRLSRNKGHFLSAAASLLSRFPLVVGVPEEFMVVFVYRESARGTNNTPIEIKHAFSLPLQPLSLSLFLWLPRSLDFRRC